MFKRIMFGLFALSVVAIWVSEANAIFFIRGMKSVDNYFVMVESSDDLTDVQFTAGVYGLPAEAAAEGEGCLCGEVRGNLYCAEDDTPEAKLSCQGLSGNSAALVIAIDKYGIPSDWDPVDDYNFSEKTKGQRLELAKFKRDFIPGDIVTFTLPPGETKKKPGWHTITDSTFDLRAFIGEWKTEFNKFVPAPDYGTENESAIKDVPLDTYWGDDSDIYDLVGKKICAVWHHDVMKTGDGLVGDYYGASAFKTISYDKNTQQMKVEVLNVYDVCGGPLYNDPKAGMAEDPDDYVCQVDQAVVFAPAPISVGGNVYSKDTFEPKSGTIECSNREDGKYDCYGQVDIDLYQTVGQQLCEEKFPDIATIKFVTFTPINNKCGIWSFTAYAKDLSEVHPELSDEVKCRQLIEPGTTTSYSQYKCYDLDYFDPVQELPTCFGCGQRPWKLNEAVIDICAECPF